MFSSLLRSQITILFDHIAALGLMTGVIGWDISIPSSTKTTRMSLKMRQPSSRPYNCRTLPCNNPCLAQMFKRVHMLISCLFSFVHSRGPFLAEIELQQRFLEQSKNHLSFFSPCTLTMIVGEESGTLTSNPAMEELLNNYFIRFADKPVCYHDLRM